MTGSLNPEGPRRGRGGTRAQTRPPRPRLRRRRTAGQVAALGIPFLLRATGGNKSRELGCGSDPEPGLGGGQGPQDRAAERPGRARAEPNPDRPEPVYRSRRGPGDSGNRGREIRRPRHRPADPPHLDLPTPLSPMIRIFRVVSTSSSILTFLHSEPSSSVLVLNRLPGRPIRACALLRNCHLFGLDCRSREGPFPP